MPQNKSSKSATPKRQTKRPKPIPRLPNTGNNYSRAITQLEAKVKQLEKSTVKVSPCAIQYASAMRDSDPNVYRGPPPCVIDDQANPSVKSLAYGELDLVIGTTHGFALFNPYAMMTSSTSVYFTDGSATYAGSIFTKSATGVVGAATAGTAVTLGAALVGRPVSVTIKVSNVSPNDNKSGMVYFVQEKMNRDLDGLSVATTRDLNYRRKKVLGTDAKRSKFNWLPMNTGRTIYVDTLAYGPGAAFDIGVIISGTPGEKYHIEYWSWGEVLGGTHAAVSATPSDSDSFFWSAWNGFISAIPNAVESRSTQSLVKAVLNYAKNHITGNTIGQQSYVTIEDVM